MNTSLISECEKEEEDKEDDKEEKVEEIQNNEKEELLFLSQNKLQMLIA